MWSAFTAACGASVPFLIDNMVPLINTVGLLLVLYGLQHVRSQLKKRAKLIARLEEAVGLKQDDGQH